MEKNARPRAFSALTIRPIPPAFSDKLGLFKQSYDTHGHKHRLATLATTKKYMIKRIPPSWHRYRRSYSPGHTVVLGGTFIRISPRYRAPLSSLLLLCSVGHLSPQNHNNLRTHTCVHPWNLHIHTWTKLRIQYTLYIEALVFGGTVVGENAQT